MSSPYARQAHHASAVARPGWREQALALQSGVPEQRPPGWQQQGGDRAPQSGWQQQGGDRTPQSGWQQQGGNWAPQPGVPEQRHAPLSPSQRPAPLPASQLDWRFRLNLAFQEDIPESLRGLMIAFCVFLSLHVFLQFLNVVAAGVAYNTMYPGVVVSSVFLAVVTSVCAYLFWYRPLYAAFRDRSGFDYACFMLVFFGQMAVYLAQFAGIVPMWPGFLALEGFPVGLAVMECLLLTMGIILYVIVFCFWNSPHYNPKRD